MNLIPSSTSPYLFLWHLFLVFFGTVIVCQVLFLLLKQVAQWRLKVYHRKHSQDGSL